jgi:hypothetical protein
MSRRLGAILYAYIHAGRPFSPSMTGIPLPGFLGKKIAIFETGEL